MERAHAELTPAAGSWPVRAVGCSPSDRSPGTWATSPPPWGPGLTRPAWLPGTRPCR
ncbi:hypothetical protein NKH77_09860 [Streptomyces sp. M19]